MKKTTLFQRMLMTISIVMLAISVSASTTDTTWIIGDEGNFDDFHSSFVIQNQMGTSYTQTVDQGEFTATMTDAATAWYAAGFKTKKITAIEFEDTIYISFYLHSSEGFSIINYGVGATQHASYAKPESNPYSAHFYPSVSHIVNNTLIPEQGGKRYDIALPLTGDVTSRDNFTFNIFFQTAGTYTIDSLSVYVVKEATTTQSLIDNGDFSIKGDRWTWDEQQTANGVATFSRIDEDENPKQQIDVSNTGDAWYSVGLNNGRNNHIESGTKVTIEFDAMATATDAELLLSMNSPYTDNTVAGDSAMTSFADMLKLSTTMTHYKEEITIPATREEWRFKMWFRTVSTYTIDNLEVYTGDKSSSAIFAPKAQELELPFTAYKSNGLLSIDSETRVNQVQIYSISGVLLKDIKGLDANRVAISVTSYNGLYIVRVNNRHCRKVVL